MNKKLSIFAIVLIIVGLIGSIWSGFFSMPYFINKLQDFDKQVNKESIIYKLFLNTQSAKYKEETPIKRQVIDFIAGMTDDLFHKEIERY